MELLNQVRSLNNVLHGFDPFDRGDSFRINNCLTKNIKLLSHEKGKILYLFYCIFYDLTIKLLLLFFFSEFVVNLTYNNDGTYSVKLGNICLKIKNASLTKENDFVHIKIETEENVMSTKLAFSGTKVYAFDKVRLEINY